MNGILSHIDDYITEEKTRNKILSDNLLIKEKIDLFLKRHCSRLIPLTQQEKEHGKVQSRNFLDIHSI